jgi:hypothetical protein
MRFALSLAATAALVASSPSWASQPAPPAARLAPPKAVVRSDRAAVIEYTLDKAAREVTLDILDAAGVKIRTYRGPSEGNGAGPPTAAGTHRVTWDLRYAPPVAFGEHSAGTHAEPVLGPVALPGRYQVRLTVDGGKPQSRPLEIGKGQTAAGVTDADLKQHFDLALKVRDRIDQANQAGVDIQSLRSQLPDRLKNARSPAVGLAADVVDRKLREATEALYQPQPDAGNAPDARTGKPGNRLSALARRLEASDGKPDDADVAAFDEASKDLDGAMQLLRTAVSNEVTAFNNLLKNGGLEPLDLPATLPKPAAK